jgi:hypothetical protein
MWWFRQRQRSAAKSGSPESSFRVLAVLSPEQQMSIGGIPAEAIAGVIDGGVNPGEPISPTKFRSNRVFVAFMQRIIGTLGRSDPALIAEARRLGRGSIGIIDLRTPEGVMGNVPLEDIVGFFPVQNGELGEYEPNDRHVVLSVNGLVQLPPSLRDLHVRELMRLKIEQK